MSASTSTQPATPTATRPTRRRARLAIAGWALLVPLSAVPLLGAVSDLAADAHGTLPADHLAAFRAATGDTVPAAGRTVSGTGRYLHVLEIGYAAHELVFAVLLLAIVIGPLRHRRLWAWLSCWTLVTADLAYAATLGRYDPSLLQRSVLAAAATTAALAALAPSVTRRVRS